jgi:hypothetical protein
MVPASYRKPGNGDAAFPRKSKKDNNGLYT